MSIFMLILLLIALIYSLVQMKKGARWAKPVMVMIILVTLPMALISMMLRMRRPPPFPEHEVRVIMCRELAKAFSEYLPSGGKVLVFSSDSTPGPSSDYIMKGLKSGLSRKRISITKIIGLPELGFPEIRGKIPEKYKRQVLTFYNENLAENSGIDGWISFGRIPENLKELDVFSNTYPPKVALAEGDMSHQLATLMQEGYIQTIVAGSPEGFVMKQGKRISPEALFHKRYMVVTPSNLGKIIEKYPQFGPAGE